MSILPIRQFGDQVLRQNSSNIETVDKNIKQLIKTLADTLLEIHGLGLAANQIGILERVFVMDESGNGEKLKAYANAEIISKSEEQVEDEEGCLSLGQVRMPVKRANKITVKALDIEKGEVVTIEAEGLKARILQHEIDHLNGKLIIDRTSDIERKRALKQISLKDLPRL